MVKKDVRKTKSLPKLKKELQEIFNSYIRIRDKDKVCISCGQPKSYKQAGHFYPVKTYDGLRFNEDNCHGECSYCNGFDDMHLLTYRENLKIRIGLTRYCELEMKAKDYKINGYKWSRSEILELIEYYKNKIKELK